MNSREVIEGIESIYDRFKTPYHLRMHMLRAAAVGRLICEKWVGEKINEDDIVAVLLLHDLGNIVRMTFDNPDLVSLYSENSSIEELETIKREAVERYGEDDHEVTDKMCREIGVSEKVLSLMKGHAFVKNREICVSDGFDSKICAYADQRIGPCGVMELRKRLNEVLARGSNRPWYSDFEELFDCALEIEKQVLGNVSLLAEEINDDSVKEHLAFYHDNS